MCLKSQETPLFRFKSGVYLRLYKIGTSRTSQKVLVFLDLWYKALSEKSLKFFPYNFMNDISEQNISELIGLYNTKKASSPNSTDTP